MPQFPKISNDLPEYNPPNLPYVSASLHGKSGMNSRLFFLLLMIYQTVVVLQGIDLADTGFYASFYQQIYSDPRSVTYCFMFWFSGIIGGLFMKLLPFSGLLGLRLLWVVVFMITVIMCYQFLKKYISSGYLQLSLLLLTLNLNNDPKEFYYNNFSSLLYVITAILLFHGIKNKRSIPLIGAGAVVSLNMFNRFPNLLGLGLALAIIYHAVVNRVTVKQTIAQCLYFFSGFVVMCVIIVIAMQLAGHLPIYLDSLKILAGVSKTPVHHQNVEDYYGVSKMIKTILKHWLFSVLMAGGVILSVMGFYSAENIIRTWFTQSKLVFITLKILIVAALSALMFLRIIDNISILYFFTGLTLIIGAVTIVFSPDKDINLLLFIGLFIVLVHPMGSSEGIHTVEVYSLWIAFPIAIDKLTAWQSLNTSMKFENFRNIFNIQFSVQKNQLLESKKMLFVLSVFGCLLYTYFYPHSDWENRKDMRYSVNNKYMRGIFTTKERAAALNGLLEASAKYIKPNDYVLAYDCLSLFHYMTETRPYSKNPWPWLYQSSAFDQNLVAAQEADSKLPVIVVQKILTLGAGKDWPTTNPYPDYRNLPINQPRNQVLDAFIKKYNYQEVWSSPYFKILVPPAL